jgi:hypothetical protein
MTTDRIKEIQQKTAHPNSVSVQQALLQVWNECEQEELDKEVEKFRKAKAKYEKATLELIKMQQLNKQD